MGCLIRLFDMMGGGAFKTFVASSWNHPNPFKAQGMLWHLCAREDISGSWEEIMLEVFIMRRRKVDIFSHSGFQNPRHESMAQIEWVDLSMLRLGVDSYQFAIALLLLGSSGCMHCHFGGLGGFVIWVLMAHGNGNSS